MLPGKLWELESRKKKAHPKRITSEHILQKNIYVPMGMPYMKIVSECFNIIYLNILYIYLIMSNFYLEE